MGARAAIGVYRAEGSAPMHVGARAWSGIEIYFDGYPRGVGDAILRYVKQLGGDLDAFVTRFVSGPRAWRCFISGDRADDVSLPASNEEYANDWYCYVLDPPARRLDIFATQLGSEGGLIERVSFDRFGNATPSSLEHLSGDG